MSEQTLCMGCDLPIPDPDYDLCDLCTYLVRRAVYEIADTLIYQGNLAEGMDILEKVK